jgi:hypothetical protein
MLTQAARLDKTIPRELVRHVIADKQIEIAKYIIKAFTDLIINSDNEREIIIDMQREYPECLKWFLKVYSEGGILYEDFQAAVTSLISYIFLKRRNLIDSRHTLEKITSYRTLAEYLRAHYKEILDTDLSYIRWTIRSKGHKEIVLVDNDRYAIYIPLNHEAGIFLAKNETDWCTTWSSPTNYNKYTNQGPLIVIHPKYKTDEIYEFHPWSNQFMKKNNTKEHPKIIKSEMPNLLSDIVLGYRNHRELIDSTWPNISFERDVGRWIITNIDNA